LFSKKKVKNFKKVFKVFKNHYDGVPLEVFGKNPYKTLVSTTLSSRTKDETTLKASKRLFKKAPNFKKLSVLQEKEIGKLIYPVGFYKTKAKHLKRMSKMVLEDFDGKIPRTRKNLMKLPGVGRKTANLVLNRAFGKPAIAVDTHVHKIANLLGWVNTKSPNKTEKVLSKVVPKKYWKDLNRLLVSIGRQHTTKRSLENFFKKKGLIPQEG
jgi:endonuclease-3